MHNSSFGNGVDSWLSDWRARGNGYSRYLDCGVRMYSGYLPRVEEVEEALKTTNIEGSIYNSGVGSNYLLSKGRCLVGDLRRLFLDFHVGLLHRFPLKTGYAGVIGSSPEGQGGSDKGTPCCSLKRFLYGVVSIIGGGYVSYRLIASSDDLVRPERGNMLLLFLSFLFCIYGFYLLLQVGMQYADSIGYTAKFWNEQIKCPLKWAG